MAAITLHNATSVKEAMLLLEQNADPNEKNSRGAPLLHTFAEKNDKKMVQLLLGANAEIAGVDRRGRQAIHEAAHYGSLEVAKVLVAVNADPEAKAKEEETPLISALLACGTDSDDPVTEPFPNYKMIRWLVEEQKVNVKEKDSEGDTVVRYASTKECEEYLREKRSERKENDANP